MTGLTRSLSLLRTKAALIRLGIVFIAVWLAAVEIFTQSGLSKNAAEHQARQTEFGVSGGSADDFTKKFCCGGTLGALVTNGTGLFILSNNHVLALSDRGTAGQPITQPGLIDTNCNPETVVAHLTTFVPLTSGTVDAAIAELVPGTMDSGGAVLGIGDISSVVTSPSIGMSVVKSGRTTGVTKSSIESIGADIKIVYKAQCNKGPKFTVIYNNQVMVRGADFSQSGDSGSLILTNDECHQPVALLYGGNDTDTIGNPIQDVLSAFGVSVVGNSADCSSQAEAQIAGPILQQQDVDEALAAKAEQRDYLMSMSSVLGVGVSASQNNPGRPVVAVYVDRAAGLIPPIPSQIQGMPVEVRFVEQFVAR